MRRPVISNFDHLKHANAELLFKTLLIGSANNEKKREPNLNYREKPDVTLPW